MSFIKTISNKFPPPAYLQMISVGVDISDTSLKYILFDSKKRQPGFLNISHWGDIEISENALQRGVVQEPESLVSALREVKQSTGVELVRVSLPEERAYLFETEIDRGMTVEDIKNALEFSLEENVPLSPRESLFDYHIVEYIKSRNKLRVIVTVYARDIVMSYYDACMEAGVLPLSFEIEAQAIARSTIPFSDQGTHMILDFGRTRTGVGIVHQNLLMYTSTIDIGGKDVSSCLRSVLGQDVEESKLTTIKNEQGLVSSKENPKLTKVMSETVDKILDELSVRIKYWNNKVGNSHHMYIHSIILCGGSSNMRGLQRYVTEQLNIPTRRGNVWRNVMSLEDNVPPIEQRYSFGYSTAIGLALASLVDTS